MTVLAIIFVVALLIPIGFLVAEPAKRRGRARRPPPAKASPRRSADDLPVDELVEAALDARANRRASSPTYASAAPTRFRASSGRVVSFPHVPVHGNDDVPAVQCGDGDVAGAVDAEAVDVEIAEGPDDSASAIGDGADVAPESWDPVDGDSCSGGWDDD